MSAGDDFTLEMSKLSQDSSTPYKSKKWGYLIDQNNGSYASNQIVFDLTGFYNSNKFINPREMFLVMPVVMALSTDAGVGSGLGSAPDFALAMKNGFHQLISSMSVTYQNKDVVQITPNSNMFVSFKLMSKMSQDELANIGQTIGFSPDSATSWRYSGATGVATADGAGSKNNTNQVAFPNTTLAYQGETGNIGMLKRQLNTAFNPASAVSGASSLTNASLCNQQLKNYTTTVGSGASAVQVYYLSAIVRLSDVSDFFDKMPLTKGFYSRLTINTNQGSFAITKQPSQTAMNLQGGNISFPNGTCPIMIAPCSTSYIDTDAVQVVGSCSIGRVGSTLGTQNQSSLNIPAHPLTSCRIYAPSIELQPSLELEYLSSSRRKLVKYEDILQYQILNVGAGTAFNQNLANSIVGAKGIVIMPFIASTVNGLSIAGTGTAGNTVPFSPVLSPFACEPATSSPLLSLTNWNVQLSNQNVLNINDVYNWESFLIETNSAYAVNGGLSTITSGLIDQTMWENNYRYYYLDLARRLKDDTSPKSVSVYGTNSSLVAVDYYVFIIYEKQIVIDCETGALLE